MSATTSSNGTPPLSTPRAPEDLIPLIQRELADGARHYRAAGALLLEAKLGVRHGEFQSWIAAHFALSYETAKLYMRLAAGNGNHVTLSDARHDPSTRRKAYTPDPSTRRKAQTRARVQRKDQAAIRTMAYKLIDAGHRALAVKFHPDKPGGSVEAMTQVNLARDLLVQRTAEWHGE